MWITNGPQAGICVTYANEDPEQHHRTVNAYILESEWDGFTVGKVEEKMGIRCSSTSELVFDGVKAPQSALFLGVGMRVSRWRWLPWTVGVLVLQRRH